MTSYSLRDQPLKTLMTALINYVRIIDMTLIECELYQYIFQINSQKVSDIFCYLYTA